MINRNAVLEAEKNLFNSFLSGDLLKKYDSDIQQIIKVYSADAEIKNIMQVFKLTAADFKIIYNHLLNSYEFDNLIFLGEVPCLLATAILLDIQSVLAMANRIAYSSQIEKRREFHLIEHADFVARFFFNKYAVMQKIVSIQYFCRDGICCRLRN